MSRLPSMVHLKLKAVQNQPDKRACSSTAVTNQINLMKQLRGYKTAVLADVIRDNELKLRGVKTKISSSFIESYAAARVLHYIRKCVNVLPTVENIKKSLWRSLPVCATLQTGNALHAVTIVKYDEDELTALDPTSGKEFVIKNNNWIKECYISHLR